MAIFDGLFEISPGRSHHAILPFVFLACDVNTLARIWRLSRLLEPYCINTRGGSRSCIQYTGKATPCYAHWPTSEHLTTLEVSVYLHTLLFARSLGHRFGAGAAPFGSAFRTRVPRPAGIGLLPPRKLRVPFQKLLLLATRRCRDLGAAHLCALWDVSRLTGQKGETPCRPN